MLATDNPPTTDSGIESPSSMLDAALAYAARGWEIFPAKVKEKKSYKSKKYSNGKNWGKTKEPEEIKHDFKKFPRAGIGLPTGKDNGFFVVEADTPKGHDVDGIAALRALEGEHGALPETLMAESPSGSLHYYFKWPADIGVGNSTSKIAPGVDVRGEGGMVIAPPSIRADGAYRWLNEETPIADAPEWLIELVREGDRKAPTVENGEPVPDHLLDIGPVGLSDDPADNYSCEADIAKVAAAMAVIPNNDVSQNEYNTVGMACWAATGGSEAGFELFDQWARKSKKKYHGGTFERWAHYANHPPTKIGAGSIFHWANEADPNWIDSWRQQVPIYQQKESGHNGPKLSEKARNFKATPFEWIDPNKIPPREWLYRPHYIREFLSLVFSSGGKGKSSLLIAEALAMATGKPLLNVEPERPLRVWYWNGEDPMLELQRRFAAAIKHYGLTREDIGDRLFIDSGRTLPIVIAEEVRFGARVCEPVVKDVIATLLENQIDVLIIDPFVSCHHVGENDNDAIDLVAKSWSKIAEEAKCSVAAAHHTRKSGGDRATVDDGRGASALRDAARTARAINTMMDTEAEKAQIEERERRFYFRVDIGKANMTVPAEHADWYKLVSVDLENQPDFALDSDKVGVVTPWDYPVADMPNITHYDIVRIQAAIKAGGPWREDQRSKKEPWVGIPIANDLKLDLLNKIDKRAAADIVRDWLAAGLLKRVNGKDANHELRTYVEVGAPPVVDQPRATENDRKEGEVSDL